MTEEQNPPNRMMRKRMNRETVRCNVSGYACSYAYKHGCKCITCLDAHRDRCRRTTDSNKKKAFRKHSCNFPDKLPSTGYQYGCRCKRCKTANTKSMRQYRERRYGKKGKSSDTNGTA